MEVYAYGLDGRAVLFLCRDSRVHHVGLRAALLSRYQPVSRRLLSRNVAARARWDSNFTDN